MDLDLSLAASFLVLAEERHYGRAATRLSVSSSALTKRIQRLERQLGVVVLDRGPGGVLDLTPAGLRFSTEVGPLLAHAEAVCSIARTGRRDCVLRLGIPAGTAEALRPLDLAGAAREVRSSFPETRLVRVDVDFSELTRCLPDGRVDVLFTSAPVRHAAVTSERLGLTIRRIGLVGRQHALADAGSVDVADYLEQRMIFNPSVPLEWMSPFWLGDMRSRRNAQLVAVDAQDHATVIQQMARAGTVTVSLELSAALLGPHHRSVTLNGAPAVPFYAARRRADRRGHVLALVDSLLSMCSRRSERNTVSCLEPQVVTGGR
jgi:DNA-binding transcriptional LysR family regulator